MINVLRHKYIILGVSTLAIAGGSIAAIRYIPDHTYTSSNASVIGTEKPHPSTSSPTTHANKAIPTPTITGPNAPTPSAVPTIPVVNSVPSVSTTLSAAQCADIKAQEQAATSSLRAEEQQLQTDIKGEESFISNPYTDARQKDQAIQDENNNFAKLNNDVTQVGTVDAPYDDKLAAGGCS